MSLQPVSQLVLPDQRQKIDESLAVDKWTIVLWPTSQCSARRGKLATALTSSHIFFELNALSIKFFSYKVSVSEDIPASKHSQLSAR